MLYHFIFLVSFQLIFLNYKNSYIYLLEYSTILSQNVWNNVNIFRNGQTLIPSVNVKVTTLCLAKDKIPWKYHLLWSKVSWSRNRRNTKTPWKYHSPIIVLKQEILQNPLKISLAMVKSVLKQEKRQNQNQISWKQEKW